MHYKIISPDELQKTAEKTEKANKQWMAAINKKQSNKLDSMAHQLHAEVFSELDCLDCANCCKSISPTLYDKDIERLAKTTRMKSADFIEKYLLIDKDKDYVFKQTPCPFLDAENYCVAYESRPKACREYPHTDRARFYQILKLTLRNTFVCPAAYYVMEKLRSDFK